MTENNAPVDAILVDGHLIPIQGATIQFSDLARFQPKILFGDPSRDDNDLLSVWQLGDYSGGLGVSDLKEGTDQQRFSISTADTRFPFQLTKPPFVFPNNTLIATRTGDKQVLGEFWGDIANRFYFVWTHGLNVRRGLIDSSGYSVDVFYDSTAGPTGGSSGVLPFGPANKGVGFKGTYTEERFFIPYGNNGYGWISEQSTAVTSFATPKFAAFANWDNKLIGITTGGRMYYSFDGTTFTAYDLTFQLSRSYRIRNLVNFFDRRDEPTLFVVTDRDLWQFDPGGPELFRIDNGWPSHPYHGQASCTWNGQLFVSVGMAVFRYSGGAWMPVGLDRDDGLPAEFSNGGRIVDMVAGWNGLYALVQGGTGDRALGGKSAIFQFTGTGWHMVWNQDTAVPSSIQYHAALATTPLTMFNMVVTQSGQKQTLIFGTGGSDDGFYSMPLSMSFANPRVGITGGADLFGSGLYYYHETGEFDADMFGYLKVGNAIQYVIEEPVTIATPSQRDTIRILMRLDRGQWQLVESRLAVPGRYVTLLGTPDALGIYPGVVWERIQIRTEILRAGSYNADKPMLLTNMILSFVKTVQSNNAWTVRVPITPEGYGDMNGRELSEFIDGLIESRRFVQLKVGEREWRVMMTQNGGNMKSGVIGDVGDGMRNIALVEIPGQI